MDTFRIVRFYQDPDWESVIVKKGLSLAEAQEHCQREDTHGKDWFDGYEQENRDDR